MSELLTDERGVSEVLGSVLVFGLALALVVLVQTVAIPQANEEAEFKHSQRVQGDMGELQSLVSRTAATGSAGEVSIETGFHYPTRVLFINPPPPAGAVRTGNAGSITLDNARATDPETADFLGGGVQSFQTRPLVYQPNYNEYGNAPEVVYEHTVLTNRFDDGGVTIKNRGDLVSGNRISLVAIDGSLSTSQADSTSVSTTPLSAPAQTVSVTGDGRNIVITLPTTLSDETWEDEILNDEMQPSGNIVEIRPDPVVSNAIEIVLDGTKTYNLRMAEIGVGSGFTEEGVEYVTTLEGDEVSVPQSGFQTLKLQVRDRFNAPVTDATVNLTVKNGNGEIRADGTFQRTLTDVEPNENGVVEVTYQAPATTATSPLNVDVQASVDVNPDTQSYDGAKPKNATFDLRVINGSKVNRTNPLINDPGGIIVEGANFTDADCVPGGGGNEKDCELNIKFRNNAGDTRSITKIRYGFYSADSQGAAPSDPSSKMEIQNLGNAGTDLVIKGRYKSLTPEPSIAPGATTVLTVHTFEDESESTALAIDESEFFVIEVVVDTGVRRTYFFAPNDASTGGPN